MLFVITILFVKPFFFNRDDIIFQNLKQKMNFLFQFSKSVITN